METITERFLRYVRYDTTSDESSSAFPSTESQRTFGAMLVKEMQEMGITDASMDKNGYVTGTVPGDPEAPVIGLLAHMDLSDGASGANIQPQTVLYEGGDILLNPEQNIWLRADENPGLAPHIGKHLIVTDGTTLLGGDDKAGIAAILGCAQTLLHTDRKHATMRIGFTPDEEIGRGVDFFDVSAFAADYAYTVDGGELGELEYENFNAASALVEVFGKSFHPGSSKGKMINSQLVAMEFQNMLPQFRRPEHTDGYEGFIHLTDMEGNVEKTALHYIVRDHDLGKLRKMQSLMQDCADFLNRKYGEGTVRITAKDSYYNMAEKLVPCMYIVERAKTVMEKMGITPITRPIRGGTDGARLSFMGLPCPNLGTGSANCHGRFEYAVAEDMEKNGEFLAELLCTY